jgi:CRP-like cAMP-binding protein
MSAYLVGITGNAGWRQWLRDATALPPNGRESAMPQSPNRILNALPQNVFAAIEPHLQSVTLAFGDIVAEAGQPIRKVYFPFTGVVSLVVEMDVGEMIETAMVGRDGVANGAAALDSKMALHKGIVQVEGAAATINPDTLRNLAHEFDPLHSLLIRHEQVLLAQVQQSAGCNASHTVEARMCRWLLRMRDLTQSNDLKLTQEFLAQMLGVRRTSVSLVAGTLQRAGFIKYRRGNIHLVDVEQLQQGACERYETVKDHYARLLAP